MAYDAAHAAVLEVEEPSPAPSAGLVAVAD